MTKKIRILTPVLILAVIFTLSGMMGQIMPAFTKPPDRGFTGMEGFVDDYVGYVSYVKEGLYGANFFSIRSIPPPQPATTAQLILVYAGKIGRIFGCDAPLTYHMLRAVCGITLFLLIYKLMHVLAGN